MEALAQHIIPSFGHVGIRFNPWQMQGSAAAPRPWPDGRGVDILGAVGRPAPPVPPLGLQTINAQVFGHRFEDAEPHQMDVIARTALIGCHLSNEGDAEFVSAAATIENVTTWSRLSEIENRMMFDSDTNHFEGGEIRYKPAAEMPTADLGDLTTKLHHLLTLPDFEHTRGATTARIMERTSVEFSSTKPRPLREWLELLARMSDLMSLSTLMACTENTLHDWTPGTPEAYPNDYPLRDRLHEVEVYERRVVTPDPDQIGADLRKFVLTLEDLEFAAPIPRWMEVMNQFASARSMVLGLSYITEGYLQTRAVTAVGAAESFHREMSSRSAIGCLIWPESRESSWPR